MTDGIELLKHRVVCPGCAGDDIRVKRTETVNTQFVSDELPNALILTTHYECNCGHKFNIGIRIEGLTTEVVLDECLR